jgi:hypothetical protein
MPKYTCPKCGEPGYLMMKEVRNYAAGTFSYRIRMVHYPKGGKQYECHLAAIRPQDLKRKEPKEKEGVEEIEPKPRRSRPEVIEKPVEVTA